MLLLTLPLMNLSARSKDSGHPGIYIPGTMIPLIPMATPVVLRSQRGLNAPELQEEFERTSGQTSNAYINYTKDFGNHALAFMVGTEKQVLKGNQFQAFRNGYISTAVDELFAGTQNASTTAGNNVVDGKLYKRTRLNYFGRINYSFSEKYLLEMVWRYDASYIFPEDSRWGFFPGVSAGWVLSEERFYGVCRLC